MRGVNVAIIALLCSAAAEPGEVKTVTPPTKAAARISVEPPSFDFGKALQHRTLMKEFSVRNFGTADLLIENVSTTCGCTVAAGYSPVVKPGGTTQLRVSLETRTYSGRVERKVLIRSNDPAKGILEVKVAATVTAQ